MPTTPSAPSFPPELQRAWGAEGEEEYRQLLRVTRAAQGGFFLLLIESDYSPAVRDTMLDCLRDDLAAGGLRLRRVTLTADCADLFRLPELETPADPDEAIVLVGIENTPGLVSEPGRKPERPPIFALLNRLRETLHSRLPAPFLVWCTPSIYTGLQTHAPDFFDHYAGLFQFLDAAPAALPDRLPIIKFAEAHLHEIVPPATIRSAIVFYEQQIAQLPEPTSERARALLGLADALDHLRGPDYPHHVRRALHVLEEALALLSPKRDAYEWARGQIYMGNAYSHLRTEDHAQYLQQAIACYQTALSFLTETNAPQEWAMAQNNLGNAYIELLTNDRMQNLQQAITYLNEALRVYTETDFPYEWASTQNSLGNAYSQLAAGDQFQDLLLAIKYYQTALRVITEADYPYDWATMQNNLGRAYGHLLTKDRAQSLQQAIACFQASLRVRTQANFPYEWATTQNNLGNAYYDLTTGDQTQNRLRAVVYYEAALHVFTETGFLREWTITQNNIALTLKELGNIKAFRQALHCAIAGYRQLGLEAEAKRAESILHELVDA